MTVVWLLLIFALSLAKQYQIDIKEHAQVRLQKSERVYLLPFRDVAVDKLAVKSMSNDTYQYTTLCTIKPASLKANVRSIFVFNEENPAPKIISSLKELRGLKNAIDIASQRNSFYVIFKSGAVEVYNQAKASEIVRFTTLNYGKEVSEGRFTQAGDVLFYASPTELLRVSQSAIVEVANYQANLRFLYPYFYADNSLFVALESGRVLRYTFDTTGNNVTKQVFLDLSSIQNRNIQIEDFGYDHNLSLIMVLDYVKGVRFFNIKDDTLALNTTYSIDIPGCENMEYRDHTLYLTCPDLITYNLKTLELRRRPSQIQPEDLIITLDKEIILKGSSHIVYYRRFQSRPLIEQLIDPTRLVYRAGSLVYINNYQLVHQSFKIYPDYLSCSAGFYSPGEYSLLVSSTGACDRRYTEGTADDNCTYRRIVDIEVWKAHQINWGVIVVGLVFLSATFLGCCSWCVIKNMKLKGQYDVLIEEMEGDGGFTSGSRKIQVPSQSFAGPAKVI